MKQGSSRHNDEAELTRLLSTSPLLDPMAKRQWLRVLPHLMPADRARLRQILEAASAPVPTRL